MAKPINLTLFVTRTRFLTCLTFANMCHEWKSETSYELFTYLKNSESICVKVMILSVMEHLSISPQY